MTDQIPPLRSGTQPVEPPRRREAAAPLGDKVLVTGASGFIGTHLVPALLDAGRTVRAMVRSDEGAARVDPRAEIVRADITDADSLKGVADGCGLVYHLAGDYRGSAAEMHTVHAAGTAKLLRVVDPRARVVFVSSSSVYGWDRDWPADHTTRPKPETAYGSAKLAAERLVLARPEGPSVVARTTIVYGIGDDGGMLARAHRLMSKGMRRFPGTGQNRIHLLQVDDLVAGLLLLAGQGSGVFLFAGPSAAPISRIFTLLAEGAGLPAPGFGVPASVLRPVAKTIESAWAAAGRDTEPPLNRHSLDVITRDRAYSWARAHEELGWSPRVELEEGVPQLGRWLSQRSSTSSTPSAGPTSKQPSAASIASGNSVNKEELGYDWRGYMEDPDEGLGTVYERFALHDVLMDAVTKLGARNVLHAPLIGMMGIPGIDALMLAREGIEVGLLDFVPERLESIVKLWNDLGVEVTPHLVPSADPATWPAELPVTYDLVFSFAALWWFEDPWAVLRVQARWAAKGVLVAVPNKNIFMRARAKLWHRDLFTQLNEEALDRHKVVEAAREIGLNPVDTGLFDIPPFPDTSVPLARVVKAVLNRKPGAGGKAGEGEGDGPWKWSILPYLTGEQPDIEDRMRKLARWERFVPDSVAPGLAHHRYTLLEKTPLPMS